MRLREFQENASRKPSAIATALQSQLGKLVRIGGATRFYEVNNEQAAAVYLIDNTTKAFGLAWPRGLGAAGVSTVYVWKQFDISRSPDFMVLLPVTGDTQTLIMELGEWIKNP